MPSNLFIICCCAFSQSAGLRRQDFLSDAGGEDVLFDASSARASPVPQRQQKTPEIQLDNLHQHHQRQSAAETESLVTNGDTVDHVPALPLPPSKNNARPRGMKTIMNGKGESILDTFAGDELNGGGTFDGPAPSSNASIPARV